MFNKKRKTPKAQSMIEIIIAIGLFSFGAVIAAAVLMTQSSGSLFQTKKIQAINFAEEGLEAARIIRNRDWLALRPGTYGVEISGNQARFTISPNIQNEFTRTITITEINETTREISSIVTWQTSTLREHQVALKTQLTDWWILGRNGLSGDWSNLSVKNPELNLDGEATNLAVQDRIAYLAVSNDGSDKNDFYAIDVADPDHPTILGSLNIIANTKGLNDVAINGDYAYVASRDENFVLHIINIADPNNPTLVSSFSPPNFGKSANTVAINFPYVYLGTDKKDGEGAGKEEFLVINVSNPNSPTLVGSTEFGDNIEDITLENTLAYVAAKQDDYGELVVVDISNPAMPQIIGDYNPSGEKTGYGVSIVPEQNLAAFVRFEGNPEFITLDISNPARPTPLGSARSPEHYSGVLAVYPLAFAIGTHNSKELVYYNISNPSQPIEIAQINLPAQALGAAFERNYLYVALQSAQYPLAIITAQ